MKTRSADPLPSALFLGAVLMFTAAHAAERPPARAPAPTAPLPGRGLAQHDFLCAGQWDTRHEEQTVYLVRDGRVVWSHSIPNRDALGRFSEFSDIHLLSNGHLLYARKTGATEITPGKEVVWNYECPEGVECHTAQPIGLDKVFLCINGDPPVARLVDKRTGAIEMEHPLPMKPLPADPRQRGPAIHGQYRHIRMTRTGTYLLACPDLNKVVEYSRDWREVWTVEAPRAWTAVRLPNGHTLIGGNQEGYVREVDSRGKIVWEINRDDLPGLPLYCVQEVVRLANGNTVLGNWGGVIRREDWEKVVQYIEVTPAKQVVWAIHQWKDPDLGPGSMIQLLDEPGKAEAGDLLR